MFLFNRRKPVTDLNFLQQLGFNVNKNVAYYFTRHDVELREYIAELTPDWIKLTILISDVNDVNIYSFERTISTHSNQNKIITDLKYYMKN